jgi:hypothetical protein
MSQLDLQEDIYNYLTTRSSVKVYDYVPRNESGTYIVIGDTISNPHNTDTSVGTENVVSFHISAVHEGKKRCKEVMKEIETIFNRDTSFVAVNFLLEHQSTHKDKNGINTLGLMRFRVTLEN